MNKILKRCGKMGEISCKIIETAIDAVDPYQCIENYLDITGDTLLVGNQRLNLGNFERIFLIGFGKASVPMAKAVINVLNGRISTASVVTKDEKYLLDDQHKGFLRVFIGDHPMPSERSITATREIITSLPKLNETDLVIVVVSGGGSALFTDPVPGVSLEDLRKTTEILLRSGADIHQINTLRKHLDRVKGGGLAKTLQPATILSLILSDVIGDNLDMIASGPTVPDPTTYANALEIIALYRLDSQIPLPIIRFLETGKAGEHSETLKPGQIESKKIQNHLVGSLIKALKMAKSQAERYGYQSLIISSHLTGETKDIAHFMQGVIQSTCKHHSPISPPVCLIFGGETTVKVQGKGKGGRNQDLVLRMVRFLKDFPDVLFISFATDGEDGPTDAAGAVCDWQVYNDAVDKASMNLEDFITNNNSYHFFEKMGGLIKTGSTGTNVNDLILILIGNQTKN